MVIETMDGEQPAELVAYDVPGGTDADGSASWLRILVVHPPVSDRDDELTQVFRLFATLLHGVKNTLAAIKLLAQGAQLELAVHLREGENAERMLEGYLQRIDVEVDRSVACLGAVRYLLASPARSAEWFSVAPIVRSVVEGQAPSLRRLGVDPHVAVEGPLVQLYGDPDDVRQVVHNLVERSRMGIQRTGCAGALEVRVGQSADFVRLTFRDGGDPVGKETQDRLSCGEFASGRDDLPLMVVHWIVARYRGRIEYLAGDSSGSVVEVWFPVAAPPGGR